MRKAFYLLSAAIMMFSCAEPFDDSTINSRLDAVEAKISKLEQVNTEVAAISQTLEALRKNYTVASISENNNGYVIKFTDGSSVNIFNGNDGQQGPEGPRGPEGPKGDPGNSPVVSVVKEGDTYYWTVNNELLKDKDGNKVSASAGTAVAPKFKADTEAWYVSVDGGVTWEVVQGATVASKITVTEDEFNVYLTLADGKVVTLPKTSAFAIKVSKWADVAAVPGQTLILPYTVSNADATTRVFIESNEVTATVSATSPSEGTITITVPEAFTPEAYVLVKAVKSTTSEYSAQVINLVLKEGDVLAVAMPAYDVPFTGGQINVDITTSVIDYKVNIPEEAASWISVVPATKGIRHETVTLAVAANTVEESRTAVVTFTAENVDPVSVTIVQAANSNKIVGDLNPSECCDLDQEQTVQWIAKVSKNKNNWLATYPGGFPATTPHEPATISLISTDVCEAYTTSVSCVGKTLTYAIGARWTGSSQFNDGDGILFTVPVQKVDAGTRATFELPFRISAGGSFFWNFEICYDGVNWEKMTTIHINYPDADGVWHIQDSPSQGDVFESFSFTSNYNHSEANVKLTESAQVHMITAIYDFPVQIINSAIKFRFTTPDAYDTWKYEGMHADPFDPNALRQPAWYFGTFLYADNPSFIQYNGPAVTFK